MPKQKTHKGLRKRVKVTATGKIKRKSAFARHLMSGKSSKRRRRLRSSVMANATDTARFREALGL